MANSKIDSNQIEDGGICRLDLNTDGILNGATAVTGLSVIRKLIAGTNLTLTSTGFDSGTGDVTINATALAIDSGVVHLAGVETITGAKTFTRNSPAYITLSSNETGSIATPALSGIELRAFNSAYVLARIEALSQAQNIAQAVLRFNVATSVSDSATVLERMRIDGVNGNVSIGTTSSTYKLDVNGTGNFSGTLTGTTATFSGSLSASAEVTWGGINSGNSRALKIGYSTSDYGNIGYGINFNAATTETYALVDIVTKIRFYDGITVSAAAAGTVGAVVSWTNVLLANRTGVFQYLGNTVLHTANIGTYAHTGTGTINYLTKYAATGTGAIVNSSIVDDGTIISSISTDVRLGTSGTMNGTSIVGLTVGKNADVDANIISRNGFNGASATAQYILNAWGNSWIMGMGSSTNATTGNSLYWAVDAITLPLQKRMVLTTGGNLGIGTLTPQQKLTLGAGNSFATEMATPAAPTLSTATTGGALAAGTYYYKIVASDNIGNTIGGTESSIVVPAGTATNTVTLSWAAITGATGYKIYRGTTAGGESLYFTSTANSYVDVDAASTVGTPPTVTTAYFNKITGNGNSWFGGNLGLGITLPLYKLDALIPTGTSGIPTVANFSNNDAGVAIGNGQAISLGTTHAKIFTYTEGSGVISLRFAALSGGVTNTIMTLNGGGNVGIGTTAPLWKVNARVDNAATTGVINPVIVVSNQTYTVNTGASLGFEFASGVIGAAITGISIASTGGAHLSFSTRNNIGTYAEGMRLTSDSLLAIGTTTSTTRLTVRGTTQGKENAIRWERTTDGAVAGGLGYYYNSENSVAIGSITNHPLHIYTNDTVRMTVSATGFVGIGQPVPDAPLHAKGGTAMTAGWNRTATIEATYPVLVFNSNNTKWAGIGYDNTSSMNFWINAGTNDVTTGSNRWLGVTNLGVATFSFDVNGVTAAAADSSTKFATTAWVKNQGYIIAGASTAGYVLKTGDTMTGVLTINGSSENLVLKSTSATGSNYIRFRNNAAVDQGYIGFGASGSNDFYYNLPNANNHYFLTSGATRLTIADASVALTVPLTGTSATFSGTVYAGTSSPNGSVALSMRYTSASDYINSVGSLYSSSAIYLGYGLKPNTVSSANIFVSSVSTALARGALVVDNTGVYYHTAASSTTAVGTAIATTAYTVLHSGNYATYGDTAYLKLTGGSLSGTLNANKININNTSVGANLIVAGNSEDNSRINISNSTGRSFSLLAGLRSTSSVGFSIYDETAGATRFDIDNSGAITVHGPLKHNSGQGNFYIDMSANSMIVSNQDTGSMVLRTSAITRMTIASGGDVSFTNQISTPFIATTDSVDVNSINLMIAKDTSGDNKLRSYNAPAVRTFLSLATTNTPTFAGLDIDKAAGNNRAITFRTSGSGRWQMGASSHVESGSNTGSVFYLDSYNDTSVLIERVLTIPRATGSVLIGSTTDLLNGKLQVTGNISTTGYIVTTDDVDVNTISYMIAKGGDNKHRSYNPGAVRTFLGTGTKDSTTVLYGDGVWRVPATGGSVGYASTTTDGQITSANFNNFSTAYTKRISSLAFSGTSTKTLTITLADATTITGTFTDDTGSAGGGITSLNSQTGSTQSFATGTSGTDFAISSSAGVHTFNIPTASAANRGLVTAADWTNFTAGYNKRPTSLAFTGTDVKTLTITLGDGTTIANTFSDLQGAGGSGLANAYTTMTDGTTSSSSSGATAFRFRSANNRLTVGVTDNDATYGDNLLLTFNEANISLTSSQVTTALGFTPYNNTNPSGFITTAAHSHGIANSAGTQQFTFAISDNIRVEGSGGTTISFDAATKKIIINSTAAGAGADGNNYPTGVSLGTTGIITISRSGLADISSLAASGTWGISVTGNAATITNQANSATINATTSSTASTIVLRDGSGYITNNYFNSSDDINTGVVTHIMAKFGDNYLRSATAAKVQTFLGLGSLAYSSATIPTNTNQLTNGNGFISNATGLISQGTNVTITGSGTAASPYVISAASGGGGGVTSITGTANQVIASASTGAVTLSLPQSIATTSSPTFSTLTVTNNVTALGFYNSSDIRLKTVLDYTPVKTDFELLKFTFKDDIINQIHYGNSAQEVEEVIPDIVDIDENGYKKINYVELHSIQIAALIKEIKDLKKQLNIIS